MEQMRWSRLVSDKRFGLEHYHDPKRGNRSEFQRDFDRLVFSSPFRRLQNKTQVFPLPGSVFVHNRLTHSIEVASVGRSLAREIALLLAPRHADEADRAALDSIGEIVAAACLAHDLGNPPFGHSGEKSISTFFSEGAGADLRDSLTSGQWADLVSFEGNANAFRLLTHQFHGRREGGFAMTYSMLASIVKYPWSSSLAGDKGKFGFFTSEEEGYRRVADELGILRMPSPEGTMRYARHPLVYIVEAADDICYEVMDIEDAHKLKILPTRQVKELFLGFLDEERRGRALRVMEPVEDPNEQVAYLRSAVIGTLVNRCARAFADNEEAILSGTFDGTLLERVPPLEREAFGRCDTLSWGGPESAPPGGGKELAGDPQKYIRSDKNRNTVGAPSLNYSRLLLSQVPRQYDVAAPTLYGKLQAVVDHVSAMTDVYALNLYRRLNGHTLPAV